MINEELDECDIETDGSDDRRNERNDGSNDGSDDGGEGGGNENERLPSLDEIFASKDAKNIYNILSNYCEARGILELNESLSVDANWFCKYEKEMWEYLGIKQNVKKMHYKHYMNQ